MRSEWYCKHCSQYVHWYDPHIVWHVPAIKPRITPEGFDFEEFTIIHPCRNKYVKDYFDGKLDPTDPDSYQTDAITDQRSYDVRPKVRFWRRCLAFIKRLLS